MKSWRKIKRRKNYNINRAFRAFGGNKYPFKKMGRIKRKGW